MRPILLLILLLFSFASFSQDRLFIKVHFLYGSKPAPEFIGKEKKWFGGIPGGHVGIEGIDDEVLNFKCGGSCHLFSQKANRHCYFTANDKNKFYSEFGGHPDSMKKAIVYIPVTLQQKKQFDSISLAYRQQTPYDYAVFGMRCSAAAYEILGQLNIVKKYSHTRTYKKIFYPKLLRKRLLAAADKNHWTVVHENGTNHRIWEMD